MIANLELNQFKEWLQQEFHIHLDEGNEFLKAELIEVSPLPAHADVSRQPFAIVFRHAGSQVLPQRIYTVEHAQMGMLNLFLVPIGPDSKGMCYEAVFN